MYEFIFRISVIEICRSGESNNINIACTQSMYLLPFRDYLNVVGMTTHNKTTQTLQKHLIADDCKVAVVKLKLLYNNKQTYDLTFIVVIGDF